MQDKPFLNRQSTRATAAQKRQQITDELSPLERLTRLDNKFGKGVGAIKERNRLMAKLTEDQRAKYEAK